MIATGLIAFVIGLQTYFMVLEMFLWRRPYGRKVFGMSQQVADDSALLAANQGLYNGFLAAGLLWSLLSGEPNVAFQTGIFFLCCVVIAGIYGGVTANRKIIYVQALPALTALIARLASI